jgi:hypothetical protein
VPEVEGDEELVS